MTKKRIGYLLLALALCVVVLCACAGVPQEETRPAAETFAQYTELVIFQDIPAMDMEKNTICYADDFGDSWYVLSLKCSDLPTYSVFANYVKILEDAGFKLYADNGKTGLGGAMFAATLIRDDVTVALTFAPNMNMMYIAAAKDRPVSPHLVYDGSYVADNIPGAKTTLTMHQLSDQGNCFVLQLKNGHYIINDGGYPDDWERLIQSLEKGVPEGQVPVVEAWFISHEHGDHVGVLQKADLFANRLIVEGFYLNEVPSDLPVGSNNRGGVYLAATHFKNAAGETSPIYRLHGGERYYFNDITIEVPFSTEQIPVEEYTDFNTSSVWLLYYIEGQKFLLAGDATIQSMQVMDQTFDKSYFDVDIMNVHHHGINLNTDDLNYFQCETLLYSSVCHYSYYWTSANKANNIRLQTEFCQEYMSYADGGKKLTFPYTVGSYETLEPWYPELSKYWVERQDGWLRDAGLK